MLLQHDADALALLDELDAQAPVPPQPRRPTWGADLRTVPELPALPYQAEALASLPGQSIKHLLLSVNTTQKPAVLWALHVALDAAGIPPCLRPEQRIHTEQATFITTLADLLWIAKRHPTHRPQLQSMRNVVQGVPDSLQWHRACLWAYQHCRGEPGWLAKRLALNDEQRRETLTLATKAQQAPRRALEKRQEDMRDELVSYALDHPDRAANRTPEQLADHRMKMVRPFIMLGRNSASTLAHLRDVEGIAGPTGNGIDRRTLRAHLERVATICRARKLILG